MTKDKLQLLIAIIVLLVSFWLIFSLRFWESVARLLQGSAIAVVLWSLLVKDGRGSSLVALLPKTIVLSFASMSIMWLGISEGMALQYSGSIDFWFLVLPSFFWYSIVPLSLLPVAIFVLIYSIFRRKLQAWQILLSSWYTSVFAVYAAFDVWWWIFILPYLNGSVYNSGAGAIAGDILRVLIAFFLACIFTFAYALFNEPQEMPP